jgi:hypothetical protein
LAWSVPERSNGSALTAMVSPRAAFSPTAEETSCWSCASLVPAAVLLSSSTATDSLRTEPGADLRVSVTIPTALFLVSDALP